MKTARDLMNELDEVIGKLSAAALQSSPNDDQIIAGHVRDSVALLLKARHKLREDVTVITSANKDLSAEIERLDKLYVREIAKVALRDADNERLREDVTVISAANKDLAADNKRLRTDGQKRIEESDRILIANERLRAELSVLSDNWTHAWAGDTRAQTIKNVETRARRALGSKP
jgi:ribonuclease HII